MLHLLFVLFSLSLCSCINIRESKRCNYLFNHTLMVGVDSRGDVWMYELGMLVTVSAVDCSVTRYNTLKSENDIHDFRIDTKDNILAINYGTNELIVIEAYDRSSKVIYPLSRFGVGFITSTQLDFQDNIWVADTSSVLIRIPPPYNDKSSKIDKGCGYSPYAIDSNGDLWGVCFNDNHFIKTTLGGNVTSYWLDGQGHTMTDSQGNLWYTGDSGFERHNVMDFYNVSTYHTGIGYYYDTAKSDADGNIWLANRDAVSKLPIDNQYTPVLYKPCAGMEGLVVSKNGVAWIRCERKGLVLLNN